jgi:hypothetical protein
MRPQLAAAQGLVSRELKEIEGDAVAELAYVLGLEAYIYGFPLVMMDVANGILTATPKSGEYSAPLNQFMRVRTFVSPDFKNVVRISVNSLWSVAVMDLDKEPLVASFPAMNERYFVMQMMNMWTDNFGSVGTRTGATGGGRFLITRPKSNGSAPANVKDIYRSSTRFAWALVQMAAASPNEFSAIHGLQDRLQLTPLSGWETSYAPPANVPVDPSVDTTATPYDLVRLMTGDMFFRRLAALLRDNPPYPADSSMIEKLKRLGIQPGRLLDANTADPSILRGLNRVPATVWSKLQVGPYSAPAVNGWLNVTNMGRYGSDYTTRTLVAWLGLGALGSEDAMYPSAFVDGDGNVLDGGGKYVLRFQKDGLPPSAVGVWSISPYRENFYVRNAMNRYGILSSMPLKFNDDGSLDIFIQADSPGADREPNWLPCPPSDPFNLTVRVYQPKQTLVDGTYKLPPVKRV